MIKTKKHLVRKAFTWTVVLTSLFVLTLGAVLIALVVGDWIFIRTADSTLSWFLGSVVMIGFLATLGSGVGVWLWMKNPSPSNDPIQQRADSMDILLDEILERD